MTVMDSHNPGTISWVDLATPDLERARAFYGALFNWSFDVGPAELGHYTNCTLDGRKVCGMGPIMPGSQLPPAWSVYFASADADATAAKVTARGGSVVVAPMDVMQFGRMAVFQDPTGAHFGIWQPGEHKGAGVVATTGAMAWHEVATRDAPRARDFYAGVFGLEPAKLEGMEYWTLHQGPTTVGGVMQMTAQWPAEIPPHWMTYFAVDDIDASAKRVQELGGKVNVPAFDTPYGRMSVVSDPAGAVFTLIKLAPQAQQG